MSIESIVGFLHGTAAFGIGNMTQVNTIAGSINTAIDSFGGNTGSFAVELCNLCSAGKVYQALFVVVIVFGAGLKLDLVWNIADTLNGFMALPNLIALLGLSPVVVKLTKDHFRDVALRK